MRPKTERQKSPLAKYSSGGKYVRRQNFIEKKCILWEKYTKNHMTSQLLKQKFRFYIQSKLLKRIVKEVIIKITVLFFYRYRYSLKYPKGKKQQINTFSNKMLIKYSSFIIFNLRIPYCKYYQNTNHGSMYLLISDDSQGELNRQEVYVYRFGGSCYSFKQMFNYRGKKI